MVIIYTHTYVYTPTHPPYIIYIYIYTRPRTRRELARGLEPLRVARRLLALRGEGLDLYMLLVLLVLLLLGMGALCEWWRSRI